MVHTLNDIIKMVYDKIDDNNNYGHNAGFCPIGLWWFENHDIEAPPGVGRE